jgi:SAM-dependent methyltransferase
MSDSLLLRILRRWPFRPSVYWLAPLLDRLVRGWLYTKRGVLPGRSDVVAAIAWDVLMDGHPTEKEGFSAQLREWYGDHPDEFEALVGAVVPRTTIEGRRKLYAKIQGAAAACDAEGQHFAREFAAATDAANEALARSLAEPLTRDGSGERLQRLADEALKIASPALKHRFYAWAEDRAAADEHAIQYAEQVFDWVYETVAKRRSVRGLRILELGPGHTLVPGVLLYVNGAKSYTGVDLFPIAGRAREFYERLRLHLEKRPRLLPAEGTCSRDDALRRFHEAVKLDGPEVVFDESKVCCRYPVDAAKLPFADGSFDLVFSIAAFEHFSEPVAAIRECERVLARGGVAIHQIDLRDHRDFAKPLDFLRYDDEEWRTLHKDPFCYTNRLRRSDFERAFVESGLVVASVEVNTKAPLDPAVRLAMHPRFRDRSLEDLETLSASFVLEKPGVSAAVVAS